ncbi:MAG TPA: hypothetical protein VG672_14645, partial [Bryobacteraceae bacterium]|nr:hypothetical protein [Bryobacteraceae bacterium]
LPFPLEVIGENVIERGGRILPVALRVLFELGPALRPDGDDVHALKVKIFVASVNEQGSFPRHA